MSRSNTQVKRPAAVFAALGDPTRLRLAVRMAGGESLSITQLAAGARMTRQAVTKHLHVLGHAGLACASRRGREQLWSLDPKQLEQARAFLDRISNQWDDALASLKAFTEE